MQRGFTLLEMLIVLAIIAMAVAGVSQALPDSQQSHLQEQAQRVSAVLEAARAQSRASGVPVRWRSNTDGFQLVGLDERNPLLAEVNKIDPDLRSSGEPELLLGPDPIIPAQSLALRLRSAPERVLYLSTDGLRPFSISAQAPEQP